MSAQVTSALTTTKATPATGISNIATIRDGLVRISGVFVGTAQITIDAIGDGTFAPMTDLSGNVVSITVPSTLRIANGVACNTRVECSVYTSGTINVGLVG